MPDIKRQKRRIHEKEIEYEDAPSGAVKLYKYKEPFMKYTEGFGFRGVLLFDSISDKIQCHLCGKWFDSLGRHLNVVHKIPAVEYKNKVGLSESTVLINEKTRLSLVASGLDKRLQNLRHQKVRKRSKAVRAKISATLKKMSMERRNVNGSCPEQILDRIRKTYDELGREFTTRHPKVEPLCRLGDVYYGTFRRACELAGVPLLKPGQNMKPKRSPYTEAELIKSIQLFKLNHKRNPSTSDCRRDFLASEDTYRRKFGSWENALKKALKK